MIDLLFELSGGTTLHVNVGKSAMHRARYIARILACVGAMAATHAAVAQTPAHRLWFSLGGGYGKSGPANSTGLDQYTGLTGDITLGVALTARGVIGLEAAGWRKDTPIGSSRSEFLSLTLLGYPFGSVLSNLYFQGGFGAGNASFPTSATTTTPSRLNMTRPSLQIALGYDVPIACPVWITPFFQSYGTFGGHKLTGPVAPNQHESANAVLYHFGVALRYSHPGPAGDCRNRGKALTEQ